MSNNIKRKYSYLWSLYSETFYVFQFVTTMKLLEWLSFVTSSQEHISLSLMKRWPWLSGIDIWYEALILYPAYAM
jgi:hypothetical protein